jgi:Fic family protein
MTATGKEWRGRFVRRSIPPRFGLGRAGRALSYRAFVPDPIADIELSLSGETAGLVAAAGLEVRDLNESPPNLVALEALATQLLRTEALASSAIEGLQLSHRRLARAAALPGYDAMAQEVLGNVRAMERAIDVGRRPARFAVADLRAIHNELAQGTRLARWAGQIRDEPGWIGGATPADARYVPPPEDRLDGLLDDLVTFVNERADLPPVLQAAIAHAQFETIHPFPDGNGRVGRCLIHVILMRSGLAPRYVPPISLVLAARRERYIDGLTTFQRGNLDAWGAFFAEATRLSAQRAEAFAESVASLQQRWREQIKARSDAAVWTLIDHLPAHPILDAQTAKQLSGKSFQTASTALDTLERADILVRRDNRKRGRSWEAPQLIDLVRELEIDLVASSAG